MKHAVRYYSEFRDRHGSGHPAYPTSRAHTQSRWQEEADTAHPLQTMYWRVLSVFDRSRIHLDHFRLRLLRRFAPNTKGPIRLAGYTIHFGDLSQLTQLYREIFVNRNYICVLGDKPVIVDAGGNIGLATLFFKRQYPRSTIIVFEPNPAAFAYLKQNLEANGITGVDPHNAALGRNEGNITFYLSTDMASADIGGSAFKQHVEYFHSGKGELVEIKVPSKRLSNFLGDGVDLLKLDIEGSEGIVLTELGDSLAKVKNVIMEYHYHVSYADNPLTAVIGTMQKASHVYRIISTEKSREISNELTYIIRSRRMTASAV